MPNWCECSLTVRASGANKKRQLRDFIRYAKVSGCSRRPIDDDDLSFERFIPYPARFEEMDKAAAKLGEMWQEMLKENGAENMQKHFPSPNIPDGYNCGGYEWCCDHWGTKWPASDVRLSKSKMASGMISYEFETAWSPPTPVVLEMSKRFPLLEFSMTFCEEGVGFRGTFSAKAGTVLCDADEDI